MVRTLGKSGLTQRVMRGAWLVLLCGAWWLPVGVVIAGTGLSLALSTRDAIQAADDVRAQMLLGALLVSRPQADPRQPHLHRVR
jgi:hypothetical protein